MAKKAPIAAKANPKAKATASATGKVKFLAYLKQGTVTPYIRDEKWTQDPWVHHGEDNLWPEKIRELVDNCAPLERAVTTLAKFIAGHGIKFYGPPKENGKRGDELPQAQALWQELMSDSSEEEFLWRCAYDLAHGLGVTFNVRRSATQIVRLDHLDRFGLRSGKIDPKTGRAEKYYWSSDWKRYAENNTEERFKPVPLKAWYPGSTDAISTVFGKNYRPREPHYGGLFWLGAKPAAEVWTKVDVYNRTQIDTGFTPGAIIGLPFTGTETEWDKIDENFENVVIGPDGKGYLLYPIAPDDAEPKVDILERGNHAGELDTIKQGAEDTIYKAFGIPELLLRDRAEGLTSQERAIAIRLQQMQNTTIKPLQKFITQPIQRLMADAGVEVYEASMVPLNVFDPAQSEQEIMASRTANESRELRGDEPTTEEWGNMPLAQVAKSKSEQQMQAEADALEKTLATKEKQNGNGNGQLRPVK